MILGEDDRLSESHRVEIVRRKIGILIRAAEKIQPGANITPQEILAYWKDEAQLAGGTPQAASAVFDQMVADARAVLGE